MTRGLLPIFDKNEVYLIGPCQWLTKNGDFTKQSWATKNYIPYDRTEVRLLVEIPFVSYEKLYRAYDIIPFLPEEGRCIITDWEGSEDWYLYFGEIPSSWIKEIKYKNPQKISSEKKDTVC